LQSFLLICLAPPAITVNLLRRNDPACRIVAAQQTAMMLALRLCASYILIHESARGQPTKRMKAPTTTGRMPMWILLLLPFVGLLWVPFYNFGDPSLFGFPFFYWYQFAWVPITSILIWLVYRSQKPDEAP
jgi:hypothetical protein